MARRLWVWPAELESAEADARRAEASVDNWRSRAEDLEKQLGEVEHLAAVQGRELEQVRGLLGGLERQTTQLIEALDRESARTERAEERAHNLVEKIVEMKREGFTMGPVGPVQNLEDMGVHLDQAVLDAIGARSQGMPQMRTQLTKWALATMREEGASAELVAKRILQGGSPPPEEESED